MTSTQSQTPSTALVPATAASAMDYYGRDRVEIIRRTVAKDANDSELRFFLEICMARGLDPFTKQVHWTPKGVIVAIDGFRVIADRTNCYRPGATVYVEDAHGKFFAADVTVGKFIRGEWWDLTERAYLDEYRAGTPTWNKMPRVMLAKCAEARALRRAFPNDLSGLYVREEMDQANERDVTPRVRAEVKPAPRPDRKAELAAIVFGHMKALDDAITAEAFGELQKAFDPTLKTLPAGAAGPLLGYRAKRWADIGGGVWDASDEERAAVRKLVEARDLAVPPTPDPEREPIGHADDGTPIYDVDAGIDDASGQTP